MTDAGPTNPPLLRLAPTGGRKPTPESSTLGKSSAGKLPPANVAFDRRELQIILNMYGRKVAEGEWRDYAIDFGPLTAVFSIFRRTSEMALYRVVKDPKLARRQGMYSVVTATGLILRRGQDLERVMAVLEKKLKLVDR
jgi:hypothetical protein